jgi:two-component system, NarL family, response regulator DesR
VIRVLVAEDQNMVRGALVALLRLEPDIEVIAELDRGDTVVAAVEALKPDVAVLDIDMPGLDGLAVAALLHERLPECRTLVLTGLSQPGYLLRALESHVRGFVLKAAPATTLAQAVRTVAAGGRVIDPELVAAALDTGTSPLTPRETEVLAASRSGRSTDDLAATLHLSPTTVRNYLSNAIAKLNARSRIDAIRVAEDAGWLPPPTSRDEPRDRF